MTALIKRHGNRLPIDFESAIDKFFSHDFPSFSEFFGNKFFSEGAYPRVDIRDFKDRAEIVAEIPGLTKEDITLDYKDGMLSIKGNKREQKEITEEHEVVTKEIKYSSFCRKIALSDDIYDIDNIKAKHEGVSLEITIPKKIEEAKDTKINIE